MTKIRCPKCKQVLQVPGLSAGQMIRCPSCGQTMALPPPAPPAAAPPPPAPATPNPVSRPAPASAGTPAPPPDSPELGSVVKDYRPRQWWIGLAASAALLVLALPLIVAAAVTGYKSLTAPSAILTIIALGGTFIFGIYTLAGLKRWVALREHGFVAHGPFETIACPWPDLAGMYVVRAGIPTSTELRFELESGKKFTLLWVIRDQDDLADRVAAATTPLIRTRAHAALARGDAVEFGPYLRLDSERMVFRPNGPSGKSLRLRWKDVESVVVGRFQTSPGAAGLAAAHVQTQLRVLSGDEPPWIIASGNVPNFPVLLDLLENRFRVPIKGL